MQEILNYGKSIRQFKNTTNKVVFLQAQHYPSFFQRHLVHPSRRIKALFHDPNANIRVFYFQYLMLCFEIQNQNYQTYIQKIHKFLLDPNFQFLFLEEDDQKIFNDKQFKRFILQFMQILDSGQYESTQAAITAYPIADIVFVYFFRSLAIYAQITKDFDLYIDKTILFGFLLQNFNIDAQMYEDKCIKFTEAEVFVYEESPQQIYLVYKQIQNTLSESNHQKNHKFQHKKQQDLDMDVDIMQGQVDSMVSSKKQVQQNISMLQYEQGGGTPIMQSYLQSKIQQKMLANNNNHIMDQSINSSKSKKKKIDNIIGNNAVTVEDGGFKKNKIADRQDVYKKITHQFQIKPSLLSCNDEPFVEISAIQYSYRQSIQGNQPEQPNQQDSNRNSNSVIDNQSYSSYYKPITPILPGYPQIQPNTDNDHNNNNINTQINIKLQPSLYPPQTYKQPSLSNSQQKIGTNQQYYSIGTADNKQYPRSNSNSLSNKQISNSYLSNNASSIKPKQYQIYQLQYKGNNQQRQTKYENKNQNKGVGYGNYNSYDNNVKYNNNKNYGKNGYDAYGNNQVTENRNKNSYSYQQAITKPVQQPYRQHSNTTFYSNQLLSRLNNLNAIINQNLSHKQITYNKQVMSPIQLLSKPNITFTNYQSNNYKSDYKTPNLEYSVLQSALATHVPATRDVPTHEIRADGKASGMTGLVVKQQFRQSLKPVNNLKNTANTQKYVPQNKTSFHVEASQKQNQLQIIQKNTNPQYKKSPLYNPILSKQSYTTQYTSIGLPSKQLTNRDLREQSLTTKQKLRQILKSKLSVSKQFTDSLTLRKMGEPYNSNIKKIKTRSRDFRHSIINSIK